MTNKIRLLYVLLLSVVPTVATTITTINDPFFAGDTCADISCDVIGNGNADRTLFDIQRGVITIAPTVVTVDLYFDFGPTNTSLAPFMDDGLRLSVGDLFFTINGTPQFVAPIVSHGDLLAGSLYATAGVDGVLTAREVLGNPSGVIYRPDAWVQGAQGDDTLGVGPGTVNITGGGDGVNSPEFHVQVQFATNDFLNPLPTVKDGQMMVQPLVATLPNLGFFFASATCGNDIIQTGISDTASAAPEPSTMGMLLIGLMSIGAGVWRRRRQ